LKELAKKLRQNSTLGEILLWRKLKNKQMLGYDFHRQKPMGNYIVDFYCPELSLAIEIDGVSHDEKIVYDENRERYLKNLGLNIIHFNESDIKRNLNDVLRTIEERMKSRE